MGVWPKSRENFKPISFFTHYREIHPLYLTFRKECCFALPLLNRKGSLKLRVSLPKIREVFGDSPGPTRWTLLLCIQAVLHTKLPSFPKIGFVVLFTGRPLERQNGTVLSENLQTILKSSVWEKFRSCYSLKIRFRFDRTL